MQDGETMARLRIEQLKARLQLMTHAEGGSYARHFTSDAIVLAGARARPASTAIWYLLSSGERSLWHVVDADEIWHHIEGETVSILAYRPETGDLQRHRLGPFDDHATPFLVVPRGCWQAVVEVGEYALCTCVVAPGFEYQGFSLIRDLGDQSALFDGVLAEWKHLL
jgi:uncharacterized protein